MHPVDNNKCNNCSCSRTCLECSSIRWFRRLFSKSNRENDLGGTAGGGGDDVDDDDDDDVDDNGGGGGGGGVTFNKLTFGKNHFGIDVCQNKLNSFRGMFLFFLFTERDMLCRQRISYN